MTRPFINYINNIILYIFNYTLFLCILFFLEKALFWGDLGVVKSLIPLCIHNFIKIILKRINTLKNIKSCKKSKNKFQNFFGKWTFINVQFSIFKSFYKKRLEKYTFFTFETIKV
jgi:hypothetical protein